MAAEEVSEDIRLSFRSILKTISPLKDQRMQKEQKDPLVMMTRKAAAEVMKQYWILQ